MTNDLFIIAIPKSSSSRLMAVTTHMELKDELVKSILISEDYKNNKNDMVYKWHYHPNEENFKFLLDNKIKTILLFRHPADQIAAAYCNYRNQKYTYMALPQDPLFPQIDYDRITDDVDSSIKYLLSDGCFDVNMEWMHKWLDFYYNKSKYVILIERYEDIVNKFDIRLNVISNYLNRDELSKKDLDKMYTTYNESKFNSKKDKPGYIRGWTGKIGISKEYLTGDNIELYNKKVKEFIMENGNLLCRLYPQIYLQAH